jgi:hypothetical protein
MKEGEKDLGKKVRVGKKGRGKNTPNFGNSKLLRWQGPSE